jgi:hypothetical protein
MKGRAFYNFIIPNTFTTQKNFLMYPVWKGYDNFAYMNARTGLP